MNITALRLTNHHLIGTKFKNPRETVGHLVAVQAQDYLATKWALGQRITNATDEIVEQAYNEGKIIRTHIMRPTWHFVLPEDVYWMQQLTAPNVRKLMASYNRKLELTDELLKKTNRLIVEILKNHHYLTRQEIRAKLTETGIDTDVQRLAHIVMWAELNRLIVNGPMRGKQFTYGLLEERISTITKLDRQEALATLALRYFLGHGPAQLQDLMWWSGLNRKDAQHGLEMVKSKLGHEQVNGIDYYFPRDLKETPWDSPTAWLMSIYDELVLSYRDVEYLHDANDGTKLVGMGNALTAVVVVDGKIVGTWKRTLKKDKVEIRLSPFKKLSAKEKAAIKQAADKYAAFLGLRADIIGI